MFAVCYKRLELFILVYAVSVQEKGRKYCLRESAALTERYD